MSAPKPKRPTLVRVKLPLTINDARLKEDVQYLARIDDVWYAGTFSKVKTGGAGWWWDFDLGSYTTEIDDDDSSWQELYVIVAPRKKVKQRSTLCARCHHDYWNHRPLDATSANHPCDDDDCDGCKGYVKPGTRTRA